MAEEATAGGALTNREKQLIIFMRELGWGEVRIRVENGQPVLIYEAIKTVKLKRAERHPLYREKQDKTGNPLIFLRSIVKYITHRMGRRCVGWVTC